MANKIIGQLCCDCQMPYITDYWSPINGYKKPFKCPVCEGKGEVYKGFYTNNYTDSEVMCRSCIGKGIVWS